LGVFLLVAAGVKSTRWRSVAATTVLTAFLAFALVLPFPTDRFVMGDGSSIVQDRSNFDDIVAHGKVVRFSAHLSYSLLGLFDRALGSNATSPAEAYRMLSWLAGLVVAVSLWCLGATDQWSSRSVRYIALALMAPATLMYFGYLEVGYLTLSAAAFPFISRDLMKGGDLATSGLLVGPILYGVGAAMHGIGYLSIAALFVAILADDMPIRRRVVLATALSGIALAAALIWLWYYLAVLGLEVIPGNATIGFHVRPLWQTREVETRILYPLLSIITARDVFFSGLIAGLPLVPVTLMVRRQSAREARFALAFSVPCMIAFLLFWPVQGIAIEMDMIVAVFPAVFALLWVSSTSVRASIVSAALLVLGHATFWWVVLHGQFINYMLR
jgi:hypothetical protein